MIKRLCSLLLSKMILVLAGARNSHRAARGRRDYPVDMLYSRSVRADLSFTQIAQLADDRTSAGWAHGLRH